MVMTSIFGWLTLKLRQLRHLLSPQLPSLLPVAAVAQLPLVKWNERCEREGDVVRSCSVVEAVARQRAAAARHGHWYVTDEEALEDFLVVHWAWIENQLAPSKPTDPIPGL